MRARASSIALALCAGAFPFAALAETFHHVVTDLDPAFVYDVLLEGSIVSAGLQPDEWGILTFDVNGEGGVQVVPVGEGDAAAPGRTGDPSLVSIDGVDATLSWQATGDDGSSGSAHHYEVRASTDSLDATAWSLATRLPSIAATVPSGSMETGVARGLFPLTDNFVVLRAVDDAGNRGPVSRPVRVTAGEGPEVPGGGEETPTFPPPGRPSAAFGGSGITVSWQRSAAIAVAGYHVYRRREAGALVRLTPPDSPLTTTEFLDTGIAPGLGYYYRITGVDASGANETAPSAEIWIRATASVPAAAAIERVYPNPIRTSATFRFAVPEFGPGNPGGAHVTIDLYDTAGHRISRVADELMNPGTHEVTWQVPNDRVFPPGVYLGVLRVGAARVQQPVAIAR